MTDRQKSLALVVLALFVQQILGALTFPVAKFGLQTLEPFAFAFFRFTLSTAVLLLIVRVRTHQRVIEREDRWRIFWLGVLIVLLNQVTYLVGQSLTAANHGSVLFATTPIFIYILARVHLKEPMTVRKSVGISLAVTGVLVIVSQGAINLGTDYLLGDFIILVAVIAWAYYTIIGRPLVQKYGALRVTAYALASGSAVYFPYGVYRALIADYSAVTVTTWLSVAYAAIGTSVVVYVLWYWVLKQMEASRVAVYHNFQPIVASGVAYVFLGEPLGAAFVIGGAIVLAGVVTTEI
ncbi:MAG: DMT family transporter [candidate division Zixibacteria bacterium]|nr:DMT family transporter [candidate division Zixibacteria bacterium]